MPRGNFGRKQGQDTGEKKERNYEVHSLHKTDLDFPSNNRWTVEHGVLRYKDERDDVEQITVVPQWIDKEGKPHLIIPRPINIPLFVGNPDSPDAEPAKQLALWILSMYEEKNQPQLPAKK